MLSGVKRPRESTPDLQKLDLGSDAAVPTNAVSDDQVTGRNMEISPPDNDLPIQVRIPRGPRSARRARAYMKPLTRALEMDDDRESSGMDDNDEEYIPNSRRRKRPTRSRSKTDDDDHDDDDEQQGSVIASPSTSSGKQHSVVAEDQARDDNHERDDRGSDANNEDDDNDDDKKAASGSLKRSKKWNTSREKLDDVADKMRTHRQELSGIYNRLRSVLSLDDSSSYSDILEETTRAISDKHKLTMPKLPFYRKSQTLSGTARKTVPYMEYHSAYSKLRRDYQKTLFDQLANVYQVTNRKILLEMAYSDLKRS